MCLGVDFGNMDLDVHFFDQVREFFSHYYFTCCSFLFSLSKIPILQMFLFVPLTAEWAMQLSVCCG